MSTKADFLQGCSQLGLQPSPFQLSQLERYVQLLKQWQKTYNLISDSTLNDIWARHILDSAQLVPLIGRGSVVDIGAGAGLPSVVLAILGEAKIYACEKLGKRVQFLNHVVRELGLKEKLVVLPKDIKEVEQRFDVVTARAVADLKTIFALSLHVTHDDTFWVLPKGIKYEIEITDLKKSVDFDLAVDVKESIVSSEGVILTLKNSRET